MSATLYTVRCSRCKASRLINGTLEFARMAVCTACTQRMTVIGHEEPAAASTDPPAVTKPPGIERCVISERTIGIARTLVMSALGEG